MPFIPDQLLILLLQKLLCGTQDLSNVTSLEICVDTQENTLGNFGKIYNMSLIKYSTVHCASLEAPFIRLYFARNMGNRCSDSFKYVQIYTNIHHNQSLY